MSVKSTKEHPVKLESDFQKRQSRRQPVLLKAKIDVCRYSFDVLVYDLSLRGAKIKLNIPLKRGAEVVVIFGEFKNITAKVAWSRNDFIGLEFTSTRDSVKSTLGELGDRLD